MQKQLLSINELEELLSREEYRFESPERCYVKKFEETNKWTDNKVLELFDTIIEETGLPPTPSEYMERAFQLTRDYWFLDSTKGRISNSKYRNGVWQIEYLHWSEDMVKAIKWRLGRMYQSLMAEYSAVCIVHTLKPKAWLLSSSQLDLALGVDLVVMDKSDNKTVYVHVTKNTGWSFEALRDKGTKTVWLKNINNKKVYWQRRFTDSHVVFVYDVEDTETVEELEEINWNMQLEETDKPIIEVKDDKLLSVLVNTNQKNQLLLETAVMDVAMQVYQ